MGRRCWPVGLRTGRCRTHWRGHAVRSSTIRGQPGRRPRRSPGGAARLAGRHGRRRRPGAAPSWSAWCTCWPPWSGSASSFFVNFVQLVALQSADEQGRDFLHKAVVPNVAWWFRHASTLAVASGAILLVTTGYLLPTLVYGTGVYVPPARAWLLWARRARRARHVDVRAHVHLAQHAGGAGLAPRRRRRQGAGARARHPVRQAQSRPRRAGRRSPWWRRRTSTDVADGASSQPRLPTPSSLPRAPASPTATLPPCSRRRAPRARPAGAGGILRRARPRAATSSRASRPWARSACSGGAMRWQRPTPARSPATPSPMPCAPRRTATLCLARSCST